MTVLLAMTHHHKCSFLLWIELKWSDSSRLKLWTRLYPIKAGVTICLLNLLSL